MRRILAFKCRLKSNISKKNYKKYTKTDPSLICITNHAKQLLSKQLFDISTNNEVITLTSVETGVTMFFYFSASVNVHYLCNRQTYAKAYTNIICRPWNSKQLLF